MDHPGHLGASRQGRRVRTGADVGIALAAANPGVRAVLSDAQWRPLRGGYCAELESLRPAVLAGAPDPAEFRSIGVTALHCAEPVEFGRDDEADVRFIRFLRLAAAANVEISWTLSGIPGLEPSFLRHLQPPKDAVSDDNSVADGWRSSYRFGCCYYRRGPGVIIVVDTRDEDASFKFALDDPAAVNAYCTLAEAVSVPGQPAPVAEMLALLQKESLIFRRGSWATILPARMKRWPVPYTAV